jgi:2OG-Fe(II) oxygenase superfamily
VNPANLINDGYCVIDDFLPKDRCKAFLEMIAHYRSSFELPMIYRNVRGRPLKYSVIDGDQIRQRIPQIHELLATVSAVISDLSNERLVPLEDARVACNVNITGIGGTYRWHYDRNRFTALLYLNEVEGGETEMYPNYRLTLGDSRSSRLQHLADSFLHAKPIRKIFGKHIEISPKAGRLLIMKGDICLHSVRPVRSTHDRINVVLSYDVPGRTFEVAQGLGSSLSTDSENFASDPNYLGK